MTPTIQTVAVAVNSFIATYGLLAIFVVMLLKEIGVPLPVPGDLIMLSAAGQAASGQLVLWQARSSSRSSSAIGCSTCSCAVSGGPSSIGSVASSA